jgi:hypothetical protein
MVYENQLLGVFFQNRYASLDLCSQLFSTSRFISLFVATTHCIYWLVFSNNSYLSGVLLYLLSFWCTSYLSGVLLYLLSFWCTSVFAIFLVYFCIEHLHIYLICSNNTWYTYTIIQLFSTNRFISLFVATTHCIYWLVWFSWEGCGHLLQYMG